MILMADRQNTDNILANKCRIQLDLKILVRITICEQPFKNNILFPNNSSKNLQKGTGIVQHGKMFSEISKIQDCMNIQKLSVIM